MPTHAEKRHLPWGRKQLFDLVADVERYPEFLPWVLAARVSRRQGPVFFAEMVIGFRIFREKFTSRVTLTGEERVDVAYTSGPLRYLNNHWAFEARPDGSCVVDFYVDFEFRSRIFQRLVGPLFNEAVRRMVGAFEERARLIYGDPRSPAAPAGATPDSGPA